MSSKVDESLPLDEGAKHASDWLTSVFNGLLEKISFQWSLGKVFHVRTVEELHSL